MDFHKAGKAKSLIPFLHRYFGLTIDKPQHSNKKGMLGHSIRRGFGLNCKMVPQCQIIGSSNYAERSKKRDNEIQAYIFSQCPMFKQYLKKEQINYKTMLKKQQRKKYLMILKSKQIGRLNYCLKFLNL
ncbi:unnamed protein product [Paramecium octaurelia]|uniref:Uncharacterized protein n=1 Tax=Paramecium octaurelia TaxID=43137 RepID=A0A8S1UFR4_PAROT|nr:unnamed protein product [Paramecium octaurelia]